jgi:FlaA1/EpsC-like NDP-sugar epimerase
MSGTGMPRIYIIGAGFAGRSIAVEITRKGILGEVVAFLDDDPAKIGRRLDSIPVLGPIEDVVSLLEHNPADEAVLAIPEISRERLRSIYNTLKKASFARIRILPGIAQIIDGEAHLIQTREIDPQDLLGRNPIKIGLKESLRYLRGRRVLITGAGGSIGSELARQLLSGGAERLYLFGHGENSIYEIDRELRILQEEGVGDRATIVPVIGELQDPEYTRFIIRRLKADVIFHTAAYKHVPILEENPVEGVRNNVFGTRHLVDAAIEAGTQRFVFISTDKTVDPVSVYGASKKIAEEIVLSANGGIGQYMVVRFGNVLGSRGSIVPLFRKQILKGGPVTITHPETSRYFMTIPEAASLVLKAGGVGSGKTVYVLDMGERLAIRDLAEQMIRFYGFEPGVQIPISYIGMRPGEKIEEYLWSEDEHPRQTEFPRILQLERENWPPEILQPLLQELHRVCFYHPEAPEMFRNRICLKKALHRAIPGVRQDPEEPEY